MSFLSNVQERPTTAEPAFYHEFQHVDIEEQTAKDWTKIEIKENICPLTSSTSKDSFCLAIIHHKGAEELTDLMKRISSLTEREFKIAVAHNAPEPILNSMVDTMEEASQECLIAAIVHHAPLDVIEKLLTISPLSGEVLRSAITHKIPANYVEYILNHVKPTLFHCITALIHRAESSVLSGMIQSEEILIEALRVAEFEAHLQDLIQATPEIFSIHVFVEALKNQHTPVVLISILQKTIINLRVFTLALQYNIAENILIGIIDALAIDEEVLNIAKLFNASETIKSYLSKEMV